jgi:hypothetical protein
LRDTQIVTQTSTSEPTPDALGLFPPDRYGRRRNHQRRRWVIPVFVAAAVAVMSLIVVKLYVEYGTAEFTPTVLRDSNITNNSITVTFNVTKSDGAAATCTVQALAYDGSQVGDAQAAVPAGKDVTVTYTLHTTKRPYVGQVPVCQAAK